MATGQEIITTVQENLGARTSGKIGTTEVSASIMASINSALIEVTKKVHLDCLRRRCQVSLTSSNYSYAIPTQDIDTNKIVIKPNGFSSAMLQTVGETNWNALQKVLPRRADHYLSMLDSSKKSRPYYYIVFGNYLFFYPWPSESYTAHFKVNIWPNLFNPNNLASEQPLGYYWDDVLVCWTTYDCFRKLQQVESRNDWYQMYFQARQEALSELDIEEDLTFPDDLDYPGANSQEPYYGPNHVSGGLVDIRIPGVF